MRVIKTEFPFISIIPVESLHRVFIKIGLNYIKGHFLELELHLKAASFRIYIHCVRHIFTRIELHPLIISSVFCSSLLKAAAAAALVVSGTNRHVRRSLPFNDNDRDDVSLSGKNKTRNLCFRSAATDPNARYVSFSCRGDKSNKSPSAPFITELPIQLGEQKSRKKWQHRSLSDDDDDHDGDDEAAAVVAAVAAAARWGDD